MELRAVNVFFFNVIVALSCHSSLQCPDELADQKAAYKSGEIEDHSAPITMDRIKTKLRDSGVFDWTNATLNDREKKELSKLFEAVEIMTTSRARQPQNVQNMFSAMRIVERAIKKQMKEGQISESLAAKFNWDKLSTRLRRSKPGYRLNSKTNMRDFITTL